MRMIALLLIALALLLPSAAEAGLSRPEIDGVGSAPPPGARLDLSLAAPDSDGARRAIGEVLGDRPGFVTLVDYTCNTLCGTALMLLGAAIERARLDPERFRIVVLGIDPKDPPQAAVAMEEHEIPPALRPAAAFLLPDAATVSRAAGALGFRYAYDAEHDQFAHPAVVYAIAPDGAVRAALSPFELTGVDLTKLLDAPPQKRLGLADRVRLLCYGYDPVSGQYTGPIMLLLRFGGMLSAVLLAGSVALLLRIGRHVR